MILSMSLHSVARARICRLQENAQGWKVSEVDYSEKLSESLRRCDMEQRELFQDLQYGKTYREHFQAIKDKTSEQSLRSCVGFGITEPKFQCLLIDGSQQGWLSGRDIPWLGAYLMPNIGESPNVARESSLSQILQAEVPDKYFLSAKACEGILRRAKARGKELPPMLREALEQQAADPLECLG